MKNDPNASFLSKGLVFRRVEPTLRNPTSQPTVKKKKSFIPNADLVGLVFNTIKWLLMSCCFIACGYQAYQFLEIFLRYETVTVTEIKYSDFVELPAITICNRNGLKRTQYCSLYKDRCDLIENATEFCDKFQSMCKYLDTSSELLFPKDEEYAREGKHPIPLYRSIGHQPSALFKECEYLSDKTYEKCNLQTSMLFPTRDKQDNTKLCYRINAENDASPETQPKVNMRKSFVNSQPAVKWSINIEPEEYFRPDRKPGALVSIHTPYRFVNPFIGGFSVEPGTIYKLYMVISEMELLPAPYDTNCTNYITRWKENNGRGPITQELCFDTCFLNVMLKNCKCVSISIQLPHDKPLCESEEQRECVKHTSYEVCQDNCGQACHSMEYTIDVKSKPKKVLEDSENVKEDHLIDMFIYFKRQDISAYSYQPKYENIELFSYVGGFLSMWLGMSLFTLVDVTGATFTIARLLFRGKPKNKTQTPVYAISKMPIAKRAM